MLEFLGDLSSTVDAIKNGDKSAVKTFNETYWMFVQERSYDEFYHYVSHKMENMLIS